METHMDESKQLSRRKFLSLSASIALGATALSLPIPCEAGRFSKMLYKVSLSRPAMGTFVNITALNSSKDRAEAAIEKAYQEMGRLVPLLSRFEPNSPVSFLNREGYLKDAPPELCQVLQASSHYNTISNGAFDITVLPILDLFEQHFSSTGLPPSSDMIDQAGALVGNHHLQRKENSLFFDQPGMSVTLDSIAKGFIVDRIMIVLRMQGIDHALVNAGGDIAVLGGKGDKKPWRIAIQDPRRQSKSIDVFSLHTGAVATSGNYEVFFDQEKLYHHLISPRLAQPVNDHVSVSVQATSVMEADALATAVFVMGTESGKKFLNTHRSIEGLIVTADNKRFSSSRWQA
jgi:FAD:protein FMN transferase